jgi:hypothetical protein
MRRTPTVLSWIERARSVDLAAILSQRRIKLAGRSQNLTGPCPLCGGTDRFAVHLGKQLFNCRGCGGRGRGAVSLVQFLDRSDFLSAIEHITGEPLTRAGQNNREGDPERERRMAQWRAQVDQERQAREDAARRDEQQKLLRAASIWDAARPITGTRGADYLIGRGIVLADAPDSGGLRWHPACPFEIGTAPCIIARFTDAVSGAPRGIHRRPITGGKPKTLGPISGGVIRLWPDEKVELELVLGEGVETTLAAATRVRHRGMPLRPAWAAGCASNMANFPILTGIERLILLVDNDASGAGQRAAASCARRWAAVGRSVVLLTPNTPGADFNDLVRI